jgi:hypothetical protein
MKCRETTIHILMLADASIRIKPRCLVAEMADEVSVISIVK